VKVEDRWLTRDAYMASKGLVPYKGRYVSPDERDYLAQRDAVLRAQVEEEMARAREGVAEPQRLPSLEDRRRKEVAETLARDPDIERARTDARYYRHDTLLGRLGYYEAYPVYFGGQPVQYGVGIGGAFYGTVGFGHTHVPHSPFGIRGTGVSSPGIAIPMQGGGVTFGTNFSSGGGWSIGGSTHFGGTQINFGTSGRDVRVQGSSTTEVK